MNLGPSLVVDTATHEKRSVRVPWVSESHGLSHVTVRAERRTAPMAEKWPMPTVVPGLGGPYSYEEWNTLRNAIERALKEYFHRYPPEMQPEPTP